MTKYTYYINPDEPLLYRLGASCVHYAGHRGWFESISYERVDLFPRHSYALISEAKARLIFRVDECKTSFDGPAN